MNVNHDVNDVKESHLVKQAQNGDEDAFSLLVERYATRLYGVCFHLLGNREDAEDCVQESFIKIYRSLTGYRFRSSFYTWAYRISVNVCLDYRRKNNRGKTVSLDEGPETSSGQLFYQVADELPLPDQLLERSELTELIREELSLLPAYLRDIVILRDLEGLSYAELAGLLKISEGTVKSRLFRGRKQLMERIRYREQNRSGGRQTGREITTEGSEGEK